MRRVAERTPANADAPRGPRPPASPRRPLRLLDPERAPRGEAARRAHPAVPVGEDDAVHPPGVAELRAMFAHLGGDLRRLFNTSGLDYRALNMKERLPSLGTDEALALLAANGNLVKRPFALGKDRGTTGFKPEEWARLFP